MGINGQVFCFHFPNHILTIFSGLLPLLKSIQKPCNLKKFEGQTLAVDAYGWLHRGTVSCAMDLAMGKPTKK
jgi:exonuclease-1